MYCTLVQYNIDTSMRGAGGPWHPKFLENYIVDKQNQRRCKQNQWWHLTANILAVIHFCSIQNLADPQTLSCGEPSGYEYGTKYTNTFWYLKKLVNH